MQWFERIGSRLKPRDLHVFMVVAEQGNMAKAARELAVSRPVVSKTIAELERLLGVRLLDRAPRGVEPTQFGRALLRRGRVVFDELRQGIEEIAFLTDPTTGTLRIACTEIWAASFVPAVIDALIRKLPNLRVQMELGTAPNVFDLLHQRTSELLVSRQLTATTDPAIHVDPLFHEKLLIVAGPSHPLASRKRLRMADLMGESWILSPYELAAGSPFQEACSAAGLALPEPAVISNSLHLRNALLGTGRFITLVPGSTLHFGPEADLLKPLAVALPRWERPAAIFTVKERMLSPAARMFVEKAHELAATIGEPVS